jgi:DNA-binding Lrp family transcriptional regulator
VATTLTTEPKKEIASVRKMLAKERHRHENSDLISSVPSREEITNELNSLGIDISIMNSLTTSDLAALLNSIDNLTGSKMPSRRGRPPLDVKNIILSSLDKKILQCLISSHGNFTSMSLSKKLGVPLSTVQRRRKRLEEILVNAEYTPQLHKLGLRTANLSVFVAGVDVSKLGREVLQMSENVTSATRTIGDGNVDLVLEVIFKTNTELISLIELIKQKDGVRNVIWNESVELLGKNKDGYIKAINSSL